MFITHQKIVFLAVTLTSLFVNVQGEAILHAFNWAYDEINTRAADIAAAGYAAVLVAPAYKSWGIEWWERYQPLDYRVIDHPLGDRTSFENMIGALDTVGVKTYADVILNHMANKPNEVPDLSYPGEIALAEYQQTNPVALFGNIQYNFMSSSDFGRAQCISNWLDVNEVQTYRLCGGGGDTGLPDLINQHQWVVEQQQQYLLALKNMGVKGFRIDAAKHMTLGHLNNVLTSNIKDGMHVFGEIITGGGAGNQDYSFFLSPYLLSTDHDAYDFPLFHTMKTAFGWGGSLTTLPDAEANGQALNKFRSITFAITHDIPQNEGFNSLILDPTDEYLIYAYIIGKDGGVPLIYSDNNESPQFNGRWQGVWDDNGMKQMLIFHNTCQGMDMDFLAVDDCHILLRRGSVGILGINKCGEAASIPVDMTNSILFWHANYTEILGSDNVVNIDQTIYTYDIPARTARMWLRSEGTASPSTSSSKNPSESPTTKEPSQIPSASPLTKEPSLSPSESPTTKEPSQIPSASPSTKEPSQSPSESPSTKEPSQTPSESPTTKKPSHSPSTTFGVCSDDLQTLCSVTNTEMDISQCSCVSGRRRELEQKDDEEIIRRLRGESRSLCTNPDSCKKDPCCQDYICEDQGKGLKICVASSPTPPTLSPTMNPTKKPTSPPTRNPITQSPMGTECSCILPTPEPTRMPTDSPIMPNPTSPPSSSPSSSPSTPFPTSSPSTKSPSSIPSKSPTTNPSTSQSQPVCGNGKCEVGESCTSCPADCDGVTGGKPSKRYCCVDGFCTGDKCPASC